MSVTMTERKQAEPAALENTALYVNYVQVYAVSYCIYESKTVKTGPTS